MEASAFITLRSPSGPTLAIEARGVGLDTKRWTAAHSKLGAASCSGTGTAVTALAVCRLRARGVQAARRSRQSRLSCRAQEESAEEQLAALEAELEALEDEMEEDRVRQADLEEAETKSKIEQRFKDAAPGLDSQVVAGRGADAVGVTATVAVCGRSHDSSVAQRVMKLLAAADSPPIFLDSQEVTRMKFEDLDEMLKTCTAAVICPEPSEATEPALEQAKLALRSILSGAEELKEVILLSHVGAQDDKGGFNLGAFFTPSGTSWASIEDELTSTARARSTNRPLRYVIVRVADPPETVSSAGEVRCFPAAEGAPVSGSTSLDTAAEAIFQVFNRSVNSSFVVIEEGERDVAPDWGELLLPFVGPEVWRIDVANVTRAVLFLQQWADEFFGPGKSALRQGVKTPVQFEKTSSGVLFKFRPLTVKDDPFESLQEGGLEFIVEEPPNGAPPRLRARRCAYGWKVVPKENSERALLEKFKRDWAEVESK
ncbi:Hypothetical protein SCF082_LOCUS22249 [Durusdinium trenchii]|uniref:Uncharacterized protein n=1 Tax=Durusdinium trenchii TaxID=1381693 RepID=A0ABP0LH49_9DINO